MAINACLDHELWKFFSVWWFSDFYRFYWLWPHQVTLTCRNQFEPRQFLSRVLETLHEVSFPKPSLSFDCFHETEMCALKINFHLRSGNSFITNLLRLKIRLCESVCFSIVRTSCTVQNVGTDIFKNCNNRLNLTKCSESLADYCILCNKQIEVYFQFIFEHILFFLIDW